MVSKIDYGRTKAVVPLDNVNAVSRVLDGVIVHFQVGQGLLLIAEGDEDTKLRSNIQLDQIFRELSEDLEAYKGAGAGAGATL